MHYKLASSCTLVRGPCVVLCMIKTAHLVSSYCIHALKETHQMCLSSIFMRKCEFQCEMYSLSPSPLPPYTRALRLYSLVQSYTHFHILLHSRYLPVVLFLVFTQASRILEFISLMHSAVFISCPLHWQ